jgi:DNA-binding LacI/PurR family transcriptional regulator
MTRDRRNGTTLEEVASRAGVSRATVSRVVNGSPRVSGDIRKAVEAAVHELGYVPNRAARSLVTRRSGSIGVIVAEPTGRLFTDPFFPRLLRGISASLSARDLQLVLLMPSSPSETHRTADYLAAGHVDGALLVSLHDDDPLPAAMAAAHLPMVVSPRPRRPMSVSYVDVDNRGGAHTAVAHLVESGRRVIATVAGPADMAPGVDRLSGYRDALTDAGLPTDPSLVAIADFTQEGGTAAMERLLADRPDIDAVFAASDLMAAGAIRALRESGRDVPDDVAVVGFDDAPLAQSTHPPLTTVHQSPEQMGREMVALLLEAMRHPDEPTQPRLLATRLVVRESS